MRVVIGILLALAALLLVIDNGSSKPERSKNGPIRVIARPLVLDDSDPGRTRVGTLHFLGGWQLTSTDKSFGGLSSLMMRPDGTLWSLNDSGVMYAFPQPGAPGAAWAKRLRPPHPEDRWWDIPTDSESMAASPDFERIWVGYELQQRICRFAGDLSVTGMCKDWPDMARWPVTESIETMVRLPDGRFLVISEGAPGGKGGRDTLLFAGDPVDPKTPPPVHMTYQPPTGYDPTDAVWIGKGRLLVLNRRATIYDGFTAVIAVVDISRMGPDMMLAGKPVARLAPPVLADNFEGLALERRDGQRILWVVSDDNHLFFQRTLLLKFALPDDL